MGFFGAAGEPEGLQGATAPSLRKPDAATHVASPRPHGSLTRSSGVTCARSAVLKQGLGRVM